MRASIRWAAALAGAALALSTAAIEGAPTSASTRLPAARTEAAKVPDLPGPGCKARPSLPAARRTKLVRLPVVGGSNTTFNRYVDFAAGRLWVSEGTPSLVFSHLLGVRTSNGAAVNVSLPGGAGAWIANDHRVWESVSDGIELARVPSGKPVRSWIQTQLPRDAHGDWISPNAVVGDTDRAYVSGFHYPSAQSTAGRYAVTALSASSRRPIWTTVLHDRQRSTAAYNIALSSSGLYLFIPSDPHPGRITVVRLSSRTGQVLARRSISAGSTTGMPEKITSSRHGVYVQVLRNQPSSDRSRLVRLDSRTLAVRAKITIGGLRGWIDQRKGGLAVFSQNCAKVAWLWRLDPTTLRGIRGPSRLPGATLEILNDSGRAGFVTFNGSAATYRLR